LNVHASKDKIFTVTSPYYLEGIKTIAFEIAEQLKWTTPDFVVVPVGTGGLISMLWKGFKELFDCGLIQELPSLIGVQIRGSDPIISRLYGTRSKSGLDKIEILATDLNVSEPPLGSLALRAIVDSKGYGISIDNRMIPDAIKELARKEGIIAEPAGVISIIALKELVDRGILSATDTVVAIVTGSGLKTINVLMSIIPIEKLGGKISSVTPSIKVRMLGDTKIKILRLLEKEPSHGYNLRKKLYEKYKILLSISTIYQHLHELRRLGFVTRIPSRKGKKRVYYYVITDRGKKALRKIEAL